MTSPINYTNSSFLIVDLCEPGHRFYAVLNFDHQPKFDGIEPTGIVHGYMLHPQQGSVLFTLIYDVDCGLYLLADNSAPIDSLYLDAMNEAIKKKF